MSKVWAGRRGHCCPSVMSVRGCLAMVLVFAASCVPLGISGDGGVDAGVASDAGTAPANVAAWTETSSHISLSSFGFWVGFMHYEKAREELSPEQLSALSGLRTMAPPTGMLADDVSFSITITDRDGGRGEFRATQQDELDSDESSAAVHQPTIRYATLSPFLATISCLRSRGFETPPRPLSIDPGCFNMSDLPDCRGAFSFDVTTPARYDIVGSSCPAMAVQLSVLDGGLVAESSGPVDGGCFHIQTDLDAGTYALDVACTDSTSYSGITIRFAPVR